MATKAAAVRHILHTRTHRVAQRMLVGAIFAAGALVILVALAVPAAADNCGTPEDCEDTGGYNGIIGVVGGSAAVAAAAAAARAAAVGPDGLEGTEDDEEIDLSILQVSTNELFVNADEPAELVLTGWHVGPDGKQRRVAMALGVEIPSGTGLSVSPAVGTGELIVTIRLDEPSDFEEVLLTARGTHKGRTYEERCTIHIEDDLELNLE